MRYLLLLLIPTILHANEISVTGEDDKNNRVSGKLEYVNNKLVVGIINNERVVGNEIRPNQFRVVGNITIYEVNKR